MRMRKGTKVTTIRGKAAMEMIPFIGDGKGFFFAVKKVKGVDAVVAYTD